MEPNRIKKIIELYYEGLSAGSIAFNLRTKEENIKHILKKYNLNITDGIKKKYKKIFNKDESKDKDIDLIKNKRIKEEAARLYRGYTNTKDEINITNERSDKIYDLYVNKLMSLEEVSKIFGITRERVRQILKQKIKKDLIAEYGDKIPRGEFDLLLIAAKQEMEDVVRNKRKLIKYNKIEKIKRFIEDNNINYKDYNSFSNFIKNINIENVSDKDIKENFLEIWEYFNNNKKWSRLYDSCIVCGTRIIKHRSNGLCENCYYKSDIWKSTQKRSFEKHKDRIVERQKEYLKIRSSKPEIKQKMRELNNKINFDGRREKAIEEASYCCCICKKTREECYAEYGKDLFVLHRNQDKKDNRLENLLVVCRKCHSDIILKKARKNKNNYT